MGSSLFPHTISKVQTLRDAALVMAKRDPNRCIIDLEPGYGPFFPATDNEVEQQESYDAYQYLKALKDEFSEAGSSLVIDNLVVHVKTIKTKNNVIEIPDLVALARVVQDYSDQIEPEALASGAFEIRPFPHKPCISIKNPSPLTMREVYQGRWAIHSETSVTKDSITEWVKSKGIDCQFVKHEIDENTKTSRAEDAPGQIESFIDNNCPYVSEKLEACLLAVKHNCEHGHATDTFKQAAERFVRKNYPDLPAGDIGSIVNINKLQGRAKKGFPSLSEFLEINNK